MKAPRFIGKFALGAAAIFGLLLFVVAPIALLILEARTPREACASWGEYYKVRTTFTGSDCLVEGGMPLSEVQRMAGPNFVNMLPPAR